LLLGDCHDLVLRRRGGECSRLALLYGANCGTNLCDAGEIATKDVLALNTGMFELYGDAANIFQKNFLGNHPVILGLFFRRRRAADPLSSRNAADGSTASADGLSTDEICRSPARWRWPKWSDLI